ncbi:hypothetical protein ORIO_08565 [Cereibacter azotoformans]|uniref:hypothetical protein n=1 Tax=Cereibacter azotoformans TaxID=43057 RepID=UPI000306A663|nr:hypothetical protein [Cereibacter azotoformans]ULB09958.1 hypothetical protein ORIO_08565 [Cereibacter azotoformans]
MIVDPSDIVLDGRGDDGIVAVFGGRSYQIGQPGSWWQERYHGDRFDALIRFFLDEDEGPAWVLERIASEIESQLTAHDRVKILAQENLLFSF